MYEVNCSNDANYLGRVLKYAPECFEALRSTLERILEHAQYIITVNCCLRVAKITFGTQKQIYVVV